MRTIETDQYFRCSVLPSELLNPPDCRVRASIDLLAFGDIMSMRPAHPLIFSDLDGTLLDHKSYSAKPADLLIDQIVARSIGDIIPITSKTHAELGALQQAIPIENMISVTENGSVVHVPSGHRCNRANGPQKILLGIEYADILDRIDNLPQILREHITGFSDMSVADVSEATGLTMDDAMLAKRREASEPFLWSGSDAAMQELRMIMAAADIQIQRGGRFYHLTGRATKDQAMARLKSAFIEQKTDSEVIAIALGDGPNDLAMIEAADIGVIMPNPEGVTIRTTKDHVRTAPTPGPQGWAFVIREIFAELGFILSES